MRPSRAAGQASTQPPIIWATPSFGNDLGTAENWSHAELAIDGSLITEAVCSLNNSPQEWLIADGPDSTSNRLRIKAAGASPFRNALLRVRYYNDDTSNYDTLFASQEFAKDSETIVSLNAHGPMDTIELTFLNIETDAGFVNEIQLGYQAPS